MDLSDLPGLDPTLGLRSTLGDRAMLRRLLHMYVASHAGDFETIARALREGRVEEARTAAHALKGVSATVGLVGAAELATRIDSALRERPPAVDLPTLLAHADAGTRAVQQLAQSLALLPA